MANLTGLLPATGANPWDLKPAIEAVNTDTESRLLTTAAPELIRDTIGTALVEGTGIDITVNDAGDTITIASDGTVNLDAVYGALASILTAGTGVTLTPDAEDRTITVTATGGGGGGDGTWGSITGDIAAQDDLTEALNLRLAITAAPELIRDTIGTALVAGSGIAVTVNDGSDTITLSTTNTPIEIEYDGSAWPTRPTTTRTVRWVSTKYAAAPNPEASMEIGDRWEPHPDYLESL